MATCEQCIQGVYVSIEPIPGVQIVERGVQMAGRELNRLRGRGGWNRLVCI